MVVLGLVVGVDVDGVRELEDRAGTLALDLAVEFGGAVALADLI